MMATEITTVLDAYHRGTIAWTDAVRQLEQLAWDASVPLPPLGGWWDELTEKPLLSVATFGEVVVARDQGWIDERQYAELARLAGGG